MIDSLIKLSSYFGDKSYKCFVKHRYSYGEDEHLLNIDKILYRTDEDVVTKKTTEYVVLVFDGTREKCFYNKESLVNGVVIKKIETTLTLD